MSPEQTNNSLAESRQETVQKTLSPEEIDAFLVETRQEAIQKTFDTNDRQRLQLMVECMGDSRGMVRLGFAETLGQIGKPATPFLTEALLNHSDPVVRRASAKTLTLIADPDTVSPLVHALLNDEDTVVKGSSVGALARIGETAAPVLLEILGSAEHPESTKGHAAWALAFIGVEAKEFLYKEISSESPVVRSAVVGAIAKVAQDSPEEQAFETLVNALNDSDETVRCEAAAVLGNLAYQPAIPKLVELLGHSNGESRKSAALALMKIGTSETAPAKDTILEPLQNALTQESETAIQRAIELAISQVKRANS